jgi:hypothetical protein
LALCPHPVGPHFRMYLLQDPDCYYPRHVFAPSAYANDKQSLGVAINGRKCVKSCHTEFTEGINSHNKQRHNNSLSTHNITNRLLNIHATRFADIQLASIHTLDFQHQLTKSYTAQIQKYTTCHATYNNKRGKTSSRALASTRCGHCPCQSHPHPRHH